MKLLEMTFQPVLKISPYTEGKSALDKMCAAFCTYIGSNAFQLFVVCVFQKIGSVCVKPEECLFVMRSVCIGSIN